MFVHLAVVVFIVAIGSTSVAAGVHLLCIPSVRNWRDGFFHGHPALLFVNLMLGLAFVFYGPIPIRFWADGTLLWRGDRLFATAVAFALVLGIVARLVLDRKKVVFNKSLPWIMPGCLGVMLSAAMCSFFLSFGNPIEMRPEPYRHFMPLFVAFLLLMILCVAWWWGGKLVECYRAYFLATDPAIFQVLLRRAELFDIQSTGRDWKAWLLQVLVRVFTTPFVHPFQVAFFMAITVLAVAPAETPAWGLFVSFTVIVMSYALSEFLPTGVATRNIIDRAFFFGGQFLVSLFVTVLGAAYWSGRPEIVILLDGVSGWHIFSIILAIYSGFWIYETWIHFLLNYHLLGLLNPTGRVPPGNTELMFAYPFAGDEDGSGVRAAGRSIETSGASLLAVGYKTAPWGPFQLQVKSHEKAAFFEALVQSGAANIEVVDSLLDLRDYLADVPGGIPNSRQEIMDAIKKEARDRTEWVNRLLPALAEVRQQLNVLANQLSDRPKDDDERKKLEAHFKRLDQGEIALHMFLLGAATPKELAERVGLRRLGLWIQGYFAGLNVVMIAGIALIVGLVMLFDTYDPDDAKQAEVSIAPAAEVGREFEFKGLRKQIFEASEKKPILLLAGSGGGTRAAVFTASVLHGLKDHDQHRQVKLCSGVSGGSAANAYFAIHYDKLVEEKDPKTAEGAWQKYLDDMAAPYIDDVLCGAGETRVVLGKVRVGTLLADSFRLHWGRSNDAEKKRLDTLEHAKIGLIFNTTLAAESDYDPVNKKWLPADARESGSRLILTNAIASKPAYFKTVKHVILDDKKIGLPEAAALSANFPPVFSNAMIEIRERKRYWVTDGGASENQGLVSLLGGLKLVLDDELNMKKNAAGADFKPAESKSLLPPLCIIAADAGALSVAFSDDRGFQPMQYSCGLYAEELEECLIKELKETYGQLGGLLTVHRLPMPEVFRGRDGVKTHWMLADQIDFSNPHPTDSDKPITLPKKAVQRMIRSLYQDVAYTGKDLNVEDKITTLQRWIDADERYPLRKKWTALIEELSRR